MVKLPFPDVSSSTFGLLEVCEDLHGGIIIVEELALGSLPDQFAVDRMDLIGRPFDDLPLSGSGKRHPEALLQLLQAVEGKAGSVF